MVRECECVCVRERVIYDFGALLSLPNENRQQQEVAEKEKKNTPKSFEAPKHLSVKMYICRKKKIKAR